MADRRDWRDTVRTASDLALVGVIATGLALPLVTAGAAAATASAALHDWSTDGRWPTLRTSIRRFGRGLLPGFVVSAIVAALVTALAIDLRAIAAGAVPGGRPLLIVTAFVAAVLAGLGALAVNEIGRRDGTGWWPAGRAAVRLAYRRPVTLVATTAVVVVPGLLGLLVIPAAAPIVGGYTLLAVHAVGRRLTPRSADISGSRDIGSS